MKDIVQITRKRNTHTPISNKRWHQLALSIDGPACLINSRLLQPTSGATQVEFNPTGWKNSIIQQFRNEVLGFDFDLERCAGSSGFLSSLGVKRSAWFSLVQPGHQQKGHSNRVGATLSSAWYFQTVLNFTTSPVLIHLVKMRKLRIVRHVHSVSCSSISFPISKIVWVNEVLL